MKLPKERLFHKLYHPITEEKQDRTQTKLEPFGNLTKLDVNKMANK